MERVDRGAYGTKGRKANAQAKPDPKTKARSPSKTSGDENSSRDSSATLKEGIMGAPPPSVQGRGRMVGLGQEMEMSSLATAQ